METIKVKQYFTIAELTNQTATPFLQGDSTWNIFFNGATFQWIATDEYLNTLLSDYIWPDYYNEYIAIETAEVNPWDTITDLTLSTETKNEIAGRIYTWINRTYTKYQKLISLYEAQKTNLMNQLSSSSKTLFNDTPQAGGDFVTDAYVTNATQVTTSTDTTTPMARLKEIEDGITNFYKDWADEFRSFIIYGNND